VAIVAAPPTISDLAAAHLPDTTVTPGDSLAIQLPRTVRVTGKVSTKGNLAEGSVPSILVFRRVSAAGPSPLGAVSQVNSTAKDGYEVFLEAGADYDVTINLDNTTRPPSRVTIRFDQDTVQPFVVPPLEDFPEFSGRVMQDAGNYMNPLASVQVSAVNMETREACTSSVSDNLGVFHLRCPQPAGWYEVQLAPTQDGPAIPTFTAVLAGKAEQWLDGDTQVPDIILPESAREVPVTVQIVGPDGAVEGIPVTVTTQLDDGCYPSPDECKSGWTAAKVTRQAFSDASGNVTVNVVACQDCTYRVEASPHPSHALGMAEKSGWDIAASPKTQLVLSPKGLLTGQVTDYQGLPVPEAQVSAQRLVGDGAMTVTSSQYVVWADTEGGYVLPIDAGDYEITVTAPAHLGLPREVRGPIAVPQEGLSIDLRLPAPKILQGRILAPAGDQPVENVTVDVFTVTEPRRLLGTGTSSPDGTYFVILPAP